MKEFRSTIYECYTNSNLTDGLGYDVTIGFAFNKKQASEIVKNKGVMGSNAQIRLIEASILKDEENNIISIEKIKNIK